MSKAPYFGTVTARLKSCPFTNPLRVNRRAKALLYRRLHVLQLAGLKPCCTDFAILKSIARLKPCCTDFAIFKSIAGVKPCCTDSIVRLRSGDRLGLN